VLVGKGYVEMLTIMVAYFLSPVPQNSKLVCIYHSAQHVTGLTWLATLLMLFPRVLSSTQFRLRSSAFCQFAICCQYHTQIKTTQLEKATMTQPYMWKPPQSRMIQHVPTGGFTTSSYCSFKRRQEESSNKPLC
jgi:hypothetical protein